MFTYSVKYEDEFANFFTVVTGEDEWQARRKADIFFSDTYGVDLSLLGGDRVTITFEGEW